MNAKRGSRVEVSRIGKREPSRARGTVRPELLPLARELRAHLLTTRLLADCDRIVVAVSGGQDSVVLLHLLRFGRVAPEVRLVVAHFDHALRPDSATDATWVRGLCAAWGIPFETRRASAAPRGEADARTERYRFLSHVANRVSAAAIVTAHHADDQAETILFRLVRGTGLPGLAGIPARRGRLVRPLLPFTRERLAEYANAVGLRYRTDATNVDPTFARNYIRHEILPRMEVLRPGVVQRIARLGADAAGWEDAWRWVTRRVERAVVTECSDGSFQLARSRLLSYHPYLRARVMRRVLRRLGSGPGRSGTLAALQFTSSSASGGVLEVAGGVRIVREFDRLIVRREPPAARPDRILTIPAPGSGRGEVEIGGRCFAVEWATGAGARDDGSAGTFHLSALRFPLELRAWRPGDRIRLGHGGRKLKKLFGEHRIPRGARASVPVLADADNEVLWVVGLARAATATPRRGNPEFRITVTDVECN